jgi:hypothetical protein
VAYFGTTPDKNNQEHDIGETAKDHAARVSGAFRPVKENYLVVQSRNWTTLNITAPRQSAISVTAARGLRPNTARLPDPQSEQKDSKGSLILLENHTINDPVLACADVVDTNGSPNFNFGSHGRWLQNLAAPGHVSHRFAQAIIHRTVGFPKNDCTARSELSDCSRAFSGTGGRTCGLLRAVSARLESS